MDEIEIDISDISIELLRQQLSDFGAFPGYPTERVFSKDHITANSPVEKPIHPWLDKMIGDGGIGVVLGKGKYYYWGPNYTADPIIFRQSEAGLEVLLIQRPDTSRWAFPGGFVDPGEQALIAAIREALEETEIDISMLKEEAIQIYSGPVADLRMTANAWAETTAIMFDVTGIDLPAPQKTDEALYAKWVLVSECPDVLFGSHSVLLNLAVSKYMELHPQIADSNNPPLQI